MKTSLVALTVLVLLVITAAVSSRDTAEASDAWPGPDGVTAADGLSPGEAVLTWATVEEEPYYRIGWIAEADYQTSADSGSDWQEGFAFTDAPNRGQASHLVTGLTPGEEYRFVVLAHDGQPSTPKTPPQSSSLLLADLPPVSSEQPARLGFQGDVRHVRNDPPESWGYRCYYDDNNNRLGSYCIIVPVGYVDVNELDGWVQGVREGAFFGLTGSLSDVNDRKNFYSDILLEMVIQPGTRGDLYRENVLADLPEAVRGAIEVADLVSESTEAFTELADSELFRTHLEHLHTSEFFFGVKLGTHLADVMIAAAANRTIEIEQAERRLHLLEKDIAKAFPDDPAWKAAFGMVRQELEDMDNPDAMTRWSNALEANIHAIALTITRYVVGYAAKTAAVAAVQGAAAAAGATIAIPAAPITLTVGLAALVVYHIIEETDQFWDEMILSSTALQVYLAMTSIVKDEDDHNILGYATFTFYQHLLNAMDTSVWIFNFDEDLLKSNRLPVTKSRDQALKQIIDTGWDPSRDIDVAEVGHLTNSALPSGAWAHGEDLWIMTWGPSTTGSGFTTNIDAYDLATRAPTDANVFSSATRSLHGMWSRGTTVWISHGGLLGGSLQAYSLSGSTGMLVRAEQHDFSTLSDAGNAAPRGIWSNHETMWVSDSSDKKVYAYRMDSRQRDPEKDLDGLKAAGNDSPGGIWSDGTTMWVVDRDDARVYAYGIATGRRDPARDIELLNIPDAVGNTDPVDIWSNGNIMWVVDEQGLKLFAYQLPPKVTSTPAAIPFQSNPSLDLNRLNLAENHEAEGIWSNGNTMWVADQDDDRVYAYGMSDGARVPSQEVNLQTQLVGGNTDATGIWSDETTMWVADHHDDRIYAYRLSGGARVEDEEYDLNQPSVHSEYATGIWFDSTNGRMWVADRLAGKIHGFDANSKELVGTIDTLDCAGNRDPQGIWSDGTTMWVADNDDDRIYAYSIGDNLRDPGKEFNTLKAANNNDARGIWSDGRTTMWVADQDKNWIYAYNMPELFMPELFLSTPAPAVLGNPSQLVVGPAGLHGVVTLNWRPAANANIHWIYLTNADGTESRYWDFELCGDANAAMIGLRHRDQEYRFRIIAGLRGTDGNIQWSDGSEWSHPILGDGFSSATIPSLGNPTSLAAAPGSQAGEVALRWSPAANATVQWVYLVKPDGTDGRYWPHALAGDAATLAVTGLDAGETYLFLVRAGQVQADGTTLWSQWSDPAQAVVSGAATSPAGEPFARNAGQDFNGLASPEGIWSDGTTMWVVGRGAKIYAYNLVTKVRDSGKDFNGLSSSGNRNSESIWSDGTTMWAARDVTDAKVYAYDMATKARVPRKDFDTLRAAGNGTPRGLWSDRVTLWVGDWRAGKIYAYDMATKARLPSNDFDTPGTVGNNAVEGLWSDGTTMWVTDHHDRKIYAYDMTTKARVVDKEFNTLASAGNQSPDGIWSDGITMWVADSDDGKLYAYKAPASVQAQQFLGTPTGLSAAPGSQSGEVVLRWTPAANATVHWVYLQKADGTDGRYWETSLAGDANTATITGLEVGQTYQFWVRAGQGRATGDPVVSEWSNLGEALPAGVVAPAPEGDRIVLHGGTLNGNHIDSTNPSLRVPPGQSISGTVDLSVTNHHGGHAIFPVGATTTWGPHQTSYWRLPIRPPAFGTSRQEVSINLTAPEQPGNYAIIFAAQAETSLGHVMSGTHWPSGGPRWDNGDDVAGWNTSQIDFAIAHGYVLAPQHGWGQPTARFGAAAVKIVVSGDASSAAPDLVVRSASVSDSNVEAGDTFTFSADVYNRGDATADSTTLRYYRSTNPTVTARDAEVSTDRVGSLDPAEVGGESERLTAPSSAGTYYYGACVDPVEGESNTGNNCSSSVRVTVTAAAQGVPDLVVYSPSVYDKVFDPGERFDMSFWVQNQGDGGSTTNATLKYYRSSDATISTSDTELAIRTGTVGVGSIAASGQSSVTIRLTAHTSGVYYYGVCVGSVPGESNTTNNCAAVFRVTLASPDLVVRSASVSDSSVEAGDRFTFSATVYNQGNGAADSTTLRYYRSTDSTVNTNDTEVDTDPVRSLDPAEDGDESERLTAPSSAGTYYYGACVDSVDGESNTRNNCSTSVMVTVTSGEEDAPDMVADPPSFNDYNPEQGTSIMLTFSARNQGDATAPATTLRVYYSIYSDFRHEIEVENFAIPSLRASPVL